MDFDDCQTCGACCVASEDMRGYADIGAEDWEALQQVPNFMEYVVGDLYWYPYERIETKYVKPQIGPCAYNTLCVCSALQGTPGVDCGCKIYEHRPTVCRRLEPGSKYCLQARWEVLGEGE